MTLLEKTSLCAGKGTCASRTIKQAIGRVALLSLFLAAGCNQSAPQQASPTTAKTIAAAQPGDPGYIAEDPRLAALVGKPGPAVRLAAIDGKTIDVGALAGRKPVYLKLWATYCIPCRAQMPGFEKDFEALGDRIQFVAVNAGVGDDMTKVRQFAAANDMRMPVAIDDGSLGAWLGLSETPLHLVIGRDGRILYAGHGDGPPLGTALQEALAQPARPQPVEQAKVVETAMLHPGDVVPTLHLRDTDGAPLVIAASTGRPRALLFTSVWCETYLKQTEPKSVAACRRIREDATRLAARPGIQWLGIASHMWTTPKDVASYRLETRQRMPYTIDDNGAAFRLFGVHKFTAVALIGADGRLVRVIEPGGGDLAGAVGEFVGK